MKRSALYAVLVVGAVSMTFTGCTRAYSNKPLPVHETRPTS